MPHEISPDDVTEEALAVHPDDTPDPRLIWQLAIAAFALGVGGMAFAYFQVNFLISAYHHGGL